MAIEHIHLNASISLIVCMSRQAANIIGMLAEHIRGAYCAIVCIVLSLLGTAWAESFRVHKLLPVAITAEKTEATKVVTGINDSIAIFLPDDMTYIAGFELLVEIPDSIAEWRDSVAMSLYGGILPVPEADEIDYTGERIFVRALPNRPSWALRVPLASLDAIKESAYATKADVLPDCNAGFVFVRLQPAMKGIPDETMEAELNIAVRPLLKKIGRLELKIIAPPVENASGMEHNTKKFTLFIDNAEKPYKGEGYLMDAGAHEVSVTSDLYRTEVRTVNIDTAKTTVLDITLKSVEPTLTVIAPDNAIVTLDGDSCPIGAEFIIREGEHTIKLSVGDWEVVRSVSIQRGKSYTADLSVDLKLTEE